ncbi:ribose/galactose ABC transporter permease [Spiroplasma sabaudiense Ar-1343]|uniref:Ribose/galactose ABC transporter permease n=1 Tax=Spiroplasma sabaudiense Ar-1343 TaxID=1276257 RepID=W6A8J5_9MOLU|nr:ABC transporter permease [Spiroplasma sabaudiense]AHI53493.1 ribose/galactose ABC transporter permease [Spiroplasma sabaudiense Ar-1343]
MITVMFAFISGVFAIFLIAAISGTLSERAGVVNISIEGFMTMGALSFAIVGSFMNEDGQNNWSQIIALPAAMAVSGLFALLHGYASIRLKSNQVVVGTAINILAQGIALYLATSGILGSDGTRIPTNYSPVRFDGNAGILNLYLVIAIVVVIAVGVFFTFTKTGKRYAAVGENPNAVDAAGINIIKYRYFAIVLSGMLAGLAGAMFVVVKTSGTFRGSTDGWGFLALAIMIVGQWRMKFIAPAALLFSVMFGLGEWLWAINGVPLFISQNADLLKVFPFLGSLLVMVLFSKWSKAPKASGIPFDKAKR